MTTRTAFSFTLFLLIGINPAFAQSDYIKFLVDTSISIMKANAVNASRADWITLSATAHAKAKGITDPRGLGSAMRYLYNSIDDFHGAFFYKDSTFQWSRIAPPPDDSIMNEWKKGVSMKTMMLENSIGYLRMPSMPGQSKKDFDKNAQSFNDSLCALLNQKCEGLILDLRLNGGGAMFSMILGCEQLLPQGIVGSFDSKEKEDWILKDHQFLLDTTVWASITPKCTMNARKIPLVLLIGPNTSSSGEFTLMAFRSRPNTVLLGNKTAGYVTVNAGFPINDTAFMNLSVGYGADRNGKVYTDAIEPDIPVTGVNKFNDIENDAKVKAAIRWLRPRMVQVKEDQ